MRHDLIHENVGQEEHDPLEKAQNEEGYQSPEPHGLSLHNKQRMLQIKCSMTVWIWTYLKAPYCRQNEHGEGDPEHDHIAVQTVIGSDYTSGYGRADQSGSRKEDAVHGHIMNPVPVIGNIVHENQITGPIEGSRYAGEYGEELVPYGYLLLCQDHADIEYGRQQQAEAVGHHPVLLLGQPAAQNKAAGRYGKVDDIVHAVDEEIPRQPP